jgi:dTDP-4-dehydrorhamnose 3,5-epimerase-like enzyme
MNTVTMIKGDVAVDDRGEVSFVNDFDFSGVKRFYMIRNHRQWYVRAWHGHRREAKYLLAVSGAALIGAVKIDNWEKPSKELEVGRYVLSAQKPAVLYIPAGHANGVMSLTEDARVIVFSTATLDEGKNDDVRFDARYWDIWNVVER